MHDGPTHHAKTQTLLANPYRPFAQVAFNIEVNLGFPRSHGPPLCITHKFDPFDPNVRKNSMWSTLELRHVDLGDQRLNRRLVKLVDDLVNQPEASVPQASG